MRASVRHLKESPDVSTGQHRHIRTGTCMGLLVSRGFRRHARFGDSSSLVWFESRSLAPACIFRVSRAERRLKTLATAECGPNRF
jgi:hypothetical protein